MIDLSGKVALVTGAGSGFGAEISRLFSKLGAKVYGGDLNEGAANDVAKEVTDANGIMKAVHMDVGDTKSYKAAVQAVVDDFGGLDIVVNNAGYTHRNMSMFDVDEKDFDLVMRVNVKSIYLCAMHAMPIMVKNKSGSVINIVSTAAIRPRTGITWYNGSKGAGLTLTKSMAAEVAAYRVRVNAVNPVMGETGMLDSLIGGDSQQKREKVISQIPMQRLSTPIDIANAAAFFASDKSAFITGTALEVDGGRCI